MVVNLVDARGKLKEKLMNRAQIVVENILEYNLPGLVEIGLFGSLVKGNFTCKSDCDIYLTFKDERPDRLIKGTLRSIAEEWDCDLVFLIESEFSEPGLLEKNIINNRQVLWRALHD